MKTDKKNLLRYFVALIIITPIFLYFKGVGLQTFSGASIGEVIMVVIIGVIVALAYIAAFHSEFTFLQKPLWGFQQTSEGYKDTSLARHPYAIGVLVFVILMSLLYTVSIKF